MYKIKTQLQPSLHKNTVYFGGLQKSISRKIEFNTEEEAKKYFKFIEVWARIDTVKEYDELMSSDLYFITAKEKKEIEAQFLKNGLLKNIENDASIKYSSDYSRQLSLFEWLDTSGRTDHTEIQDRILQSRILVLGLGGVGSIVAEGLTRMGVGTIGLLDMDFVEESNLNRQLYYMNDIGEYKTTILADRLQKVNKHTKFECYNTFINSISDLEDLEVHNKYNIVISCLDKPRGMIDKIVFDYCKNHDKIMIFGGYASTVVNAGLANKNTDFSQVFHIDEKEKEIRDYSYDFPNSVSSASCFLSAGFVLNFIQAIITGLHNYESDSGYVQFDYYNLDMYGRGLI